MANVQQIIITRLNNVFNPMDQGAADEYLRALSDFSADDLVRGMDVCLSSYEGGFRPTPAMVRKFVIDHQPEMKAPEAKKGVMDFAREMVANAAYLKKHEAYKQIEKDHMSLRRLHALIDERAMIMAQHLCSIDAGVESKAIGYDAAIAFGYNHWGGSAKNTYRNVRDLIRLANKTQMVQPTVPQEAIDWINNMPGKITLPSNADGTFRIVENVAKNNNVRFD